MSKAKKCDFYSPEQIESKAYSVLKWWAQENNESEIKIPVPVELIAENLYDLSFDLCPADDFPKDALGAINFRDKIIYLNYRDYEDRLSVRGVKEFTVGHEIGHWVLHNKKENQSFFDLGFGQSRDFVCRLEENELDWDEVNANRFSAALLIPKAHVEEMLLKTNNIYEISQYFSVSKQCAMVRINHLNKLKEKEKMKIK